MDTRLTIVCQSAEEATVIIEIFREMQMAIAKHPVWPRDAVSRAAIVAEEAGEVIREANHIREGHGNVANLRTELIQCAGTCIRMLNIMDGEKNNLNARVVGKGLAALFNHDKDGLTK